MNKETITDNLEKLLMAIHRQVVVIRDAEEQMPKIEMDKTLSNIRALYEQFTVLNYLNSYSPAKKVDTPAVEEKPVGAKKEIDPPFVPIDEKKYAPVPQAEEIKPIEKTVEQPIQPQKSETVIQKPIEAPKKAVEKTVATAATEPQRLGDRLRSQKLDDLYKAITLSDKFLYMNELFEGENSAYREAMDMLNRLTIQSEAEQYLNSLAARYRWEEHEKAEVKFRELVARKFV